MSPVTIELRKGRKRRPSNSLEDDPVMDDCMAAMVLMSLSCSPKSTFIPDRGIYSVSVKSIDSGVGFGSAASRSNTPSPCTINEEPPTASPIAIEINTSTHVETVKGNINDSNVNNNQINGLTIIHKDEGIDMDETIDFIIEDPIQTIAEARRIVFKCTWRGCGLRCDLVESIERHIRTVHLGRSETASEEENDHEEEFYYAEIEEEMETDNIIISSKDSSSSNDSSLGPLSPVSSSPESPHSTNYNLSPTLSSASLLFFAPSPTWSHLDMARPPHEDPEYQKQQKQMQLQLQLQQQQQIQNQQVQNFNHLLQTQKQPSPVTQTFISAQFKPEPERKTVISSPINIPGISVAHRWSTKVLDSSSASSSNASCNSSYSFSNSHHHHHHHLNQHVHNNNHLHHQYHHHNQSQASYITSSSPVNFFSPKAPSKVMRLSSNTSSPINIKSSGSNAASALSGTVTMNSKTNSNVTSIIPSSNPTMSTNTTTNANASSNQWTSLLQSSSTSSASSSSSSSSSSTSTAGTATTLLKGSSISPTRRTRTETRKCRKVYGMDNRDSWCTQCKWKKACTRFVD